MPNESPGPSPLRAAVVTGGHAFDVRGFGRLWRSLAPEIEADVQHLDDYAAAPDATRQSYDAVVFYLMMTDGPRDEGHPWYAGKPKSALETLGVTDQGIVVLHHSLLAYPEWPLWSELVGIPDRRFGFHMGQTVETKVADSDHPITRGLTDWTMVDETYSMASPGADSRALLTCDHPNSMSTVGWTRRFRESRVLCYQAGHDDSAFSDAGFREVLRRGILWTSRRP